MRKLFLLLLFIAALPLHLSAVGTLTTERDEAGSFGSKPFIIPEVTSWTAAEGHLFPSRRIVVKSKQLRATAQLFADDCLSLLGLKMHVASGKPQRGDIVLTLDTQLSTNDEAYQISIAEQATVAAPSTRGAFWATRTLLQLLAVQRSLPRGTIVDTPQYPLRGMLLDAGRKYIPMTYLRQLVKLMGLFKMNTLQLHLNDNSWPKYFDNDWNKTYAAFRLQCDTYPGLTATDGSYTKNEFIQLQQFAEANGVEIIPEIDSPAHSLAFTHYRPSLASKDYGMDHFDLSNPDVYTFMDALFAEYLSGPNPVFRGPRVNIGTDEYSNAKQEVVEQFRAYTDHYLALVQSYGKQPMLWGALTHAKGQTPVRHEGVLMNAWYNGYAEPDSMRRIGYQLVSIPDGLVYIVPKAGYYQDFLNCRRLYDNWTPAVIGNVRFTEQDPQIQGGMFALWNDMPYPSITILDLHQRIVPALQTIAVKTWTGQLVTLPYEPFDHFRLQLNSLLPITEYR